ncbi:uncharacterized protein F5Z01DRAFT_737503 [Emericellopsis atlantica]|uniref:Glycan binding protein Y3-like domain-containing protein n=1 Tax=Emericellopsis atlantica TaxID=2614577 RepID=A0A9P7ZLF5_9HYPO|nr:uncharacterized protein F5Z01DRAFT_737503 [Emericellopsis atlantica]KAG9253653.1 hypothetical protein F5Z01DRAFT_737503 [Emericellopsis atlantica]
MQLTNLFTDAAAVVADKACDLKLGGTYGPEGTYNGRKAACFNTPHGKMDFIITHISDGERDLSQEECYDGLQKEIHGCGKGGSSSYTNWRYKADPNEGEC